jgi:hypothetical protein
MQIEYSYTLATESELNDLLVGTEAGIAFQWPGYSPAPHPLSGSTGVLWKKGNDPGDPVQPFVLVAREEDFRRLCGRFAQLRSDLSPLTTWCHLLTPERFSLLDSSRREANLGSLQAAWTGLVVAEAQLLSEKPLVNLRFPACLATQSFAVARARALWSDSSGSETGKRFEAANRLFKTNGAAQRVESRTARVRSAIQPILSSLTGVNQSKGELADSDLRPIVASLSELQEARRRKEENEAEWFARPLMESAPEAQAFFQISKLAPEQRLKVFDQLVGHLNSLDAYKPSLRRSALALLSGYLATVAAGGTPSLSLAESNAFRWPEITAWAYVVGGIGERIVWTSSFDGLGRFVARELMRPFVLDEAPTCDFALDEALVLVDPKLSEPLVQLRIKQAKIATVALLPGVNIAISISESTGANARPEPVQPAPRENAPRFSRDVAVTIADALWPHLRSRVEECVRSTQDDDFDSSPGQRRGKRKASSQSQLPLRNSQK